LTRLIDYLFEQSVCLLFFLRFFLLLLLLRRIQASDFLCGDERRWPKREPENKESCHPDLHKFFYLTSWQQKIPGAVAKFCLLARKIVTRPAVKDAEVLLEVDGELPGCLPATFQVVPLALRIRCPAWHYRS
jgi:hypothetical protein